jgi:hypothetical protein
MKHPIKTVRAIDKVLLRPELLAAAVRQGLRQEVLAKRRYTSTVRPEKRNGRV